MGAVRRKPSASDPGHTCMRIRLKLLALLHAVVITAADAQPRYSPTMVAPIPGMGYSICTATDSLRRTVTFYVTDAPARATPVPLVVYVHGSGHRSNFQRSGNGVTPSNGHATIADVVESSARVVAVEKPGVSLYDRGDAPAGVKFREEHTLERWTEAVVAATIAASRLPGMDSTRVLVVGHSEGGLVAARVAARLPMISHVAILAGGGPSQLFDLMLLARNGTFFSDISPDADVREAYVRAQWDSVLAHPQSADREFFGHAYRRWSSFLHDSPIAQLRQTRARVFLAQGARDGVVSRESFEALAAELSGAGRRPTTWLVPDADHSFRMLDPARAAEDGWAVVLGRVAQWYFESR
jgi:pimeloyl-ACP methyl ester carboxylesterase